MKLLITTVLAAFFCLIVIACGENKSPSAAVETTQEIPIPKLDNPFPYQLNKADTAFLLPPQLQEVSGLTHFGGTELLMVNDENGIIYHYDFWMGQLIAESRFHGPGDYEGIEYVGNRIFILKSNGDLFEVSNYQSTNTTRVIETPLKKSNDTEALGFLADSRQLLIACKADAGQKGQKVKGKRGVHAFSLAADSLESTPFCMIDRAAIKAYFQSKLPEGVVWPEKKIEFNPSAIAQHPITKEIYVLASSGKLLLATNAKGEILKVFRLDPELFNHPEGMCFLPDGTLFISNEGDLGRPTLLKFSMSNK